MFELPLNELTTLFNQRYQEYTLASKPKEPKTLLPIKIEEQIRDIARKVKDNKVGNQALFKLDDKGKLLTVLEPQGIICHANYSYEPWQKFGPGHIHVYIPNNRPNHEGYLRWLSHESPYRDFLYDQHHWGEYVIGGVGSSLHCVHLAASFAMARRNSEPDWNPNDEVLEYLVREYGLDMLPALMFSQMSMRTMEDKDYDTYFPRHGNNGHSMFSWPNFTTDMVRRFLLGKHTEGSHSFSTIWADRRIADKTNRIKTTFDNVADQLVAAKTALKGNNPPDPFGCTLEQRREKSTNLSHNQRLQVFFITMLQIMEGTV